MKKPQWIIPVISAISLIIILTLRFYLSLNRFLDPDEFAHLHWTYLISLGKLPYRDIFIFHVPFFQWILSPLFFLPHSSFTIYLARLAVFAMYLACAYLLFDIARKMSRSKTCALLTVLIFLSFPMTLDKTIDIRPDILMILFFLFSVKLVIHTKKWTIFRLISTGFFYGLSLLTFPKMIYALPALIFLFLTSIEIKSYSKIMKNLILVFLGTAIPGLLFLFYLLSQHLLNAAIISIVYNSGITIGGKAPFPLLLALSPWPLVYVSKSGISLPWALNTAVWVLSLFGLVIAYKENKRLFYFSLFFLSGGIGFIYLFPLPFLQYFMPLSLFISLLSAYFLNKINKFAKEKLFFLPIFSLILVISFSLQFISRENDNNSEQLQVIKDVLKVTKENETVYDMVGSYVFRPDGYIICCHLYNEFIDKLKLNLPTLKDSLVQSETKFLVMDRVGFVFWQPLPQDLSFMKANYLSSGYPKIYWLGKKFSCKNTVCAQIDALGNPLEAPANNKLEIAVSEKYKVTARPIGEKVIIDGNLYQNPLFLEKGIHTFSLSPALTGFQIELDR